jgi:hypothetical protein
MTIPSARMFAGFGFGAIQFLPLPGGTLDFFARVPRLSGWLIAKLQPAISGAAADQKLHLFQITFRHPEALRSPGRPGRGAGNPARCAWRRAAVRPRLRIGKRFRGRLRPGAGGRSSLRRLFLLHAPALRRTRPAEIVLRLRTRLGLHRTLLRPLRAAGSDPPGAAPPSGTSLS